MSDFEKGKLYYTKDGKRVELLAMTTDGQYVVAQELEIDDWEGGSQWVRGEAFFTDALYPNKAPREVVDAEVTALREEANRLRAANAEARSEALSAERDVRQRLDKLKKYRGLERLEDFIDGKITHVVTNEYGEFKIQTLDAFENGDRYEKGIRLISLLGNSKGDLSWRVNRYKDDSGNWTEFRPCASENEAREALKAWVKEFLDEQSNAFDHERTHYFCKAVKDAIKHGVEVSDADIARYNAAERERLLKERERLAKAVADAQERLAALPPIAPPTEE